MAIGDKIKKMRNLIGITQNELGHMVKLSDDRIRHYELNDRTPKPSKLKEIADAIGVNVLAISDPDLDSYDGILHALFYLEDNYGLQIEKKDGEVIFKFRPDNFPVDGLTGKLNSWYEAKKRTTPLPTDEFEEAEKKKNEYDMWRYNFPMSEVMKQAEDRKNKS